MVDLSDRIAIKDGRHPVVEKMLSDSLFVAERHPARHARKTAVAIITGPNMAGKSTYMRQVALIIHHGADGQRYVPASIRAYRRWQTACLPASARRMIWRAGQSTFMVEMSEVADILRHATKSSLIILDEIGRGTSTYDGMSVLPAQL